MPEFDILYIKVAGSARPNVPLPGSYTVLRDPGEDVVPVEGLLRLEQLFVHLYIPQPEVVSTHGERPLLGPMVQGNMATITVMLHSTVGQKLICVIVLNCNASRLRIFQLHGNNNRNYKTQ
uniref:(northern house mosquito) hypothetical protein n=1 Tax=Culex pipiens TaxID=7175 RepID=A0A8D8ACK1_CULPI